MNAIPLLFAVPLLALVSALLPGIASAQEREPILEYPKTGMDDTVAYRGYRTRFFRDIDGNTIQVVINQVSGRVVNLWADASDESLSFTARDSTGQPAPLEWGSTGASGTRDGGRRFLQYTVRSESPAVDIGLFLLASMRKERDFQYMHKELLPLDAGQYVEEVFPQLMENLGILPDAERASHLSLLHVATVEELRSRLEPKIELAWGSGKWFVNVTQLTFDGRNLLSLQISDDTTHSCARVRGSSVSIRSVRSRPLICTIRVGTDSPSLTPLTRDQIFNERFFRYYDKIIAEGDSLRRLPASRVPSSSAWSALLRVEQFERQVKSMELLSFKEKLMAGLPNYATYFGRDMMMSAMMMESILQGSVKEHVIDCVLGKLSPDGKVSHEEALGGQAIRENAEEYNRLLARSFQERKQGDTSAAEASLRAARTSLSNLQRVRENYNMVDEDFQLPVILGRYITAPDVSAHEKETFLRGRVNGISRLALIMKNLQYVYQRTTSFEARHDIRSLVSFARADGHRWRSASWRDSDAGYGNGRFGMDINVIWVPKALEAEKTIFSSFRRLGLTRPTIDSLAPDFEHTPLRRFVEDTSALDNLIRIWHRAKDFFIVKIAPDEVKRRVEAKLAWLPVAESTYWSRMLRQTTSWRGGISFLALSLDSLGRPIPVVNTDPATLLFLEEYSDDRMNPGLTNSDLSLLVDPFLIPYPIGLYVEGLGPLIANDAYATKEVWDNFQMSEYHSPRVVWGREVSLFLLGLSHQVLAARLAGTRGRDSQSLLLIRYLHEALEKVRRAVDASGLKQSELWSYAIAGGMLVPARYAVSCDIQLWNLTDLAVQYQLDQLTQ